MSRHRDPLHCFLPPMVLESIAQNGDEGQRAWALRALDRDQTVRLARVQNQKVRAGGPREGADALAVATEPQPNRIIRDGQGQEIVNGPIMRREGDPAVEDDAANEAYDGFGDTFSFYLEVFERNSIDDEGMPLRGVVHFGQEPNAFWDGRRMLFADGDGVIFDRLTRSLDVIGHELSHGVVEDEAGLEYSKQSGALNEHVADAFGSLVKQHKLNQRADAADWLIGADVWTPNIAGDALRSMKAPGTAYDDPTVGKDNQPAHMRDYVETIRDNGGVHINSGIPNHAFYLVATRIGGFAWERAGLIWYEALQHPLLKPTSDFATFARLTLRVAERRFGRDSGETRAVREGWEGVGVATATA